MTQTPSPPTVTQIIAARRDWRARLDADYARVSARLQQAYARQLTTLHRLSADLVRDVQRLEADDALSSSAVRRLASYQALQARIESELQDFATLARFSATELRDAALTLAPESAEAMALAQSPLLQGVWLRPDPEALARLIGIADSPALRAKFAAFGQDAAQNFSDVLLALTAQGKGAATIARALDAWYAVPFGWAENITRTAQLVSYRSATAASYAANAAVLDGWAMDCLARREGMYFLHHPAWQHSSRDRNPQ